MFMKYVRHIYFRLIHIGQFLNGLAGPVSMGAPPAISAEWFAPEQRTTATAIASLSNALGCAIGFLLGKQFNPYKYNILFVGQRIT